MEWGRVRMYKYVKAFILCFRLVKFVQYNLASRRMCCARSIPHYYQYFSRMCPPETAAKSRYYHRLARETSFVLWEVWQYMGRSAVNESHLFHNQLALST